MTRGRAWLARWRDRLRRRRHPDQDLREEIRGHLEEAAQEYVRQGHSPEEARRAALLDFGGVDRAEEEYRDVRGRMWDDLGKDVRYGLRSLGRDPGFTAIAVLSLAVGIGANTLVFSLVNAFLLRPLAVAAPEKLVELYCGDRGHPYETFSHPSYLDLRESQDVLGGLAAWGLRQFNLGDANQVEQVWGEAVSGDYFDVLGIPPHSGRMLTRGDGRGPGSPAEVVISHGLWQRRFAADPTVVGRSVAINGRQMTVVGIAPPRYTGMMRGLSSDVWVPITMMPLLEPDKGRILVANRGARWLTLVGRLRGDTTFEQAKARFDILSREMQAAHPEEWKAPTEETGAIRELFVSVLRESDARVHPGMMSAVYAVAALLVGIVNVILLVACVNVAGMVLARAVVRRKEIAVRLALGAGRPRIIRQLVTESVLLSLAAGAAGLLLTVWVIDFLVASVPAFPEGMRVALDLHLDWRVFTFTIAFSTLTGIMLGLVLAVQSSKADVSAVLKDDAGTATGGVRSSRMRRMLVVVQVALSLLLLIGAGLVLRSLERVRPTRLGFASDRILVVPVTQSQTSYDRRTSQEFYRSLSERMAALPGVTAVSLVQSMPGGFMSGMRRSTEIEGYVAAPDERLEIEANTVGPRYFTNMGAPVVQGRDFDDDDRDGAPCVAIVNEAFAQRYLAASSGKSPLGRRLAKYDDEGRSPEKSWCTVVGVVRDDRWQALEKTPRPFFALALLQSHKTRISMLVQTEGDPAGLIRGTRDVIHDLDANMPVADIQTLRQYFRMTAYPFRLLGLFMGACGAIALLLVTAGIYGIVSYSAAQRTREIGVRMALGAWKPDILRLVIGEGMRLVAVGLLFGLGVSLALARVLSSPLFESEWMFGVSATDSVTFAGVSLFLACVAAVACYVPAARAASADPIEALRYK